MVTKFFRAISTRAGLLVLLLTCSISATLAQEGATQVMHWAVDGTDRQALDYIPSTAKTQATPVLFVFHGFGGNMQYMYNTHRFDQLWPGAIIVYPQGLNVQDGAKVGGGQKPGWQLHPDAQGGRDLRFFDAMLKSLRQGYKVDGKRVYATGHSNGGGFTYLLWATRGDVLAAVAPSAAPNIEDVDAMLKPKPVIQITDAHDPLVDPAQQLSRFNTVLKLNSCAADGTAYDTNATLFKSSTGNPSVLLEHPGGHVYPQDAIPVVVKFFKSVVKRSEKDAVL
jgi:polyhydroxybutyrate depolymerase